MRFNWWNCQSCPCGHESGYWSTVCAWRAFVCVRACVYVFVCAIARVCCVFRVPSSCLVPLVMRPLPAQSEQHLALSAEPQTPSLIASDWFIVLCHVACYYHWPRCQQQPHPTPGQDTWMHYPLSGVGWAQVHLSTSLLLYCLRLLFFVFVFVFRVQGSEYCREWQEDNFIVFRLSLFFHLLFSFYACLNVSVLYTYTATKPNAYMNLVWFWLCVLLLIAIIFKEVSPSPITRHHNHSHHKTSSVRLTRSHDGQAVLLLAEGGSFSYTATRWWAGNV